MNNLIPNHQARLVICESSGRAKREFQKVTGDKVEPTMVERVNEKVRTFCHHHAQQPSGYRKNIQWTPSAILLAYRYTEHVVSDVVIRALKKEVGRMRRALLSFFLCWNRCTGVAQTLNVSLLLKRSVRCSGYLLTPGINKSYQLTHI